MAYYPKQQQYYPYQGNNPQQFNQAPAPFWKGGRKPKKSGFRVIQAYGAEKGLFLAGWKIYKGKRWNVKVFRDKYQKEIAPTVSESGKKWCSVRVILSSSLENTISIGAYMNIGNHKVYLDEWNWIMNPNANNGGYIGKRFSKKK
ncbi:hypothetical protein WH52_01365 [Tenacibaculum holothuriorum]|uniref:Uncharacterized protein n=1 Tax=Tenacibaculum holothuriorum TaxID=1635173 RepID=A0A1Y2PFN6_9FLAO|nr:hypothetical protein [Tenacibaculum holothuriorum]OSY89316.1 hypothetical protein WH52_01365 [Tenacibaculum holothuriorum]